jgi:hypothetical protein
MLKHRLLTNKLNKWRNQMPTKKSKERDENGKFVSEKAIVSELGVNDTPEPNELKVVETKNGRTLTYN